MLDKIKAKRHAKVHKKFGKISEDAKEAVMEHENHLHPGKKHTKLKSGGALSEKKSHKRLDKMKRGGSKKGTKVNVNVITPHPGIKPVPVPVKPEPKPWWKPFKNKQQRGDEPPVETLPMERSV